VKARMLTCSARPKDQVMVTTAGRTAPSTETMAMATFQRVCLGEGFLSA